MSRNSKHEEATCGPASVGTNGAWVVSNAISGGRCARVLVIGVGIVEWQVC